MRIAIYALVFAAAMGGAAGSPRDIWLARVEPVMTAAERETYQALAGEDEREGFRTAFWKDKAIAPDAYFERAIYADARFGSGEPGSAANTDQGRVYLALGPPTSIAQIPSSRILVPVEIWRYDHVAGIQVSSEVQVLFFQARGAGFMKLYSPQLHTVRALLINNAGTRGAFPVNDVVTAQDVLNRLQLSPAEMEAVDAATSVSRGVRGSGNSEILFRISNPALMLRRELKERVNSRIVNTLNRPRFQSFQYRTDDRIPAIDLTFETSVKSVVGIEIKGLDSVETHLNFPEPSLVSYRHRVYLLPGVWNITLISDGQRTVFPLKVNSLSDIDPVAPQDLVPHAEGRGIPVAYRTNLTTDCQWISIGRQYLRAGNMPNADLCFRKALAVRRTPDALAGYGRGLALQRRFDDARENLLEALRLRPDHYESLVALASVTAAFDDYPQALAYYRQAQAIRPSGDIETAVRELNIRAGLTKF
ncbi:MAG: GWxTD domain-containing protein [Bryobacteraceae bacterium]|nr:GWxTD domain-containing protein [Bryobacteraceae bacterium]